MLSYLEVWMLGLRSLNWSNDTDISHMSHIRIIFIHLKTFINKIPPKTSKLNDT